MFGQTGKAPAGRLPARTARRTLVGGALVSAIVLFSAVAPVAAAPKPPPKVTEQQVSAAAAAKAALAHTVGVLSAQIVQTQAQLRSLSAAAELAEQKFAFAISKLNEAKEQATRAAADVVSAQRAIDTARRNLTSYVRNSYMSPATGSTTIGLLTATDPTALLQGGDYQQYVSAHHLDAMGALDRATVAKSNAVAKAQSLVNLKQQLKTAAAQAQQAAQQAYAQEKAQAAQLQASQASYQQQLDTAKLNLATLNNERATYVAYVREQQRIAAQAAAAAAAARARAAAEAAAAIAAQQARNNNGGGGNVGGGGNSGGGDGPLPPPGSMGGWTQSKGQAAVARAERWLGEPYSWAAGNANGPTYGVDSPGTDGWNDHAVFGFDCSGLTLYAWAAQGLYLPHYAADQYRVAGSFHPQPGQFLPGDLLFWSNGGIDGIHHVAMYIGNGNVIQAPNSGDVVKITPWDQVNFGYFGATRPLT